MNFEFNYEKEVMMEDTMLKADIELALFRSYEECALSNVSFLDLSQIDLDDFTFNVHMSVTHVYSMDIIDNCTGMVVLQYTFSIEENGGLFLDPFYDNSELCMDILKYSEEGYTSMSYYYKEERV